MIPEAAVEAAAIAVYGSECADLWADEEPKVKASYLKDARAALEAAYPHMLAPVIELSDELAASELTGDSYLIGRGSGFRIAGIRIRQVLGLAK